jgi:hypothetical protein
MKEMAVQKECAILKRLETCLMPVETGMETYFRIFKQFKSYIPHCNSLPKISYFIQVNFACVTVSDINGGIYNESM